MKWSLVLAVSAIALLIIYIEWAKLKLQQNKKKEKMSSVALTLLGWLIAIGLIFNSEIPGPSDFITAIYKPFGMLLEK